MSMTLFDITPHGQAIYEQVKDFMTAYIEPIEAQFWQDCHEQNLDGNWLNWQWAAAYETLRTQAREAGLWNLFLPDEQLGAGRAQLWREGKITLKDLLDGKGRELTLDELRDKYA